MKDSKDIVTVDGLPKKLGRPCIDPNNGPMSNAERKRRSRDLKKGIDGKLVEIAIPGKLFDRSLIIASRMGLSFDDLLNKLLSDLPMPRKPKS